MNTKQQYHHIQVTAGIGVPVCPHDKYIRDFYEDDNLNQNWSDWQAAHAGIQWHCLTQDDKPVTNGTYEKSQFGPVAEQIRSVLYRSKTIRDSDKWYYTAALSKQELDELSKVDMVYKRLVRFLVKPIPEESIEQPAEVLTETEPESIEQAAEKYVGEKFDSGDFLSPTSIRDFKAGANHLLQQGYKSPQEVEGVVKGRIEFWQNKVEKHPDTAWIFKPFIEELKHILTLLK